MLLRWAVLLLGAVTATAVAADIKVLSVGAAEPALVKLAEQFRRETGNRVRIQFATALQLERRLSAGETADVLVSTRGLMNEQQRRGRVDAEGRFVFGRVGIGVVVRAGAPEPDIADLERFKQSVLGADSIVLNLAPTGQYLERLFDLLGIGEQVKPKTTRLVSGAHVLEHLINGAGKEIGFALISEIRPFESKGLKLVGPLPAQVQQTITYAAGVLSEAPEPELAREFVRYLGTPSAKAMFSAAGIE